MKILIATENPHKLKEIKAIISADGAEFLTLRDFPQLKLPPETGKTFKENAVIKARYGAQKTKLWTLAEDTGLEVDFLGGAPGVLSARYAGEEKNYGKNNEKLLSELAGIASAQRKARFRCVMALCPSDGKLFIEEGILEGEIAFEPRGKNGFGYDPLFMPAGETRTLAEMTDEQKNKLSHRRRAIDKISHHIKLAASGKI
ncbi:MAG: RdgB/HAM1 family non-canonical purine NTP pyrophosphatase [Elusimicrobia bacterium]|nr:RdgB/HAM1 family non-canonical purine NTP pyrophosphatase [Elusimicrobiota bacterium]